jgi:hypothetical protein
VLSEELALKRRIAGYETYHGSVPGSGFRPKSALKRRNVSRITGWKPPVPERMSLRYVFHPDRFEPLSELLSTLEAVTDNGSISIWLNCR